MKKYKNLIIIWVIATTIGMGIAVAYPADNTLPIVERGFPFVWERIHFSDLVVGSGLPNTSTATYPEKLLIDIALNAIVLGGLGSLALKLRKNRSVKA